MGLMPFRVRFALREVECSVFHLADTICQSTCTTMFYGYRARVCLRSLRNLAPCMVVANLSLSSRTSRESAAPCDTINVWAAMIFASIAGAGHSPDSVHLQCLICLPPLPRPRRKISSLMAHCLSRQWKHDV